MKIVYYKFTAFLISLLLLFSFGCSSQNSDLKVVRVEPDMKNTELKVGGIYSINDGEGRFGIAKILALDEDAVHIRLYKNKFPSRPQTIDLNTLSLGTINDKDVIGIGHLPLSREGFINWQPVFIAEAPVTKEELEGYEMWKDASGGVWQ